MARKDKKSKINFRELTVEELSARLNDMQEKLFKLKFAHQTAPLKNPMDIRSARREIARIITIKKEKSAK